MDNIIDNIINNINKIKYFSASRKCVRFITGEKKVGRQTYFFLIV
jgi:hypothetical protein